MNIKKEQAVSFTGYRYQKIMISAPPQMRDLMNRIIEEVYIEIKFMYEQKGYNTFISGMAEGFDMLAAEAVLKLKEEYPEAKLIIAIPFKGQDYSYSKDDKILYKRLYDGADEIVYISDRYYDGVFLKRNDFLLDNCSHVLCYYTGLRGGTMYTYNRAVKRELAITNIFNKLCNTHSD